MREIHFYVESKADAKFIANFCEEFFNQTLNPFDKNLFTELGSWSGYKKDCPSFKRRSEAGVTNLLILDNDVNGRMDEVLQDKQNLQIEFELFLFPINVAETTGNLETILTEIAVVRKLIECFQGYENCVAEYGMSLEKARIYSYLDTLLNPNFKNDSKNDLRKEEFRDYRNTAHWDLNHNILDPLKDFLRSYLE
ncbi:MAG: hypothetical protein RIQ33_857 [Bacteroidota bacterium]|jgi:hypothetical protein